MPLISLLHLNFTATPHFTTLLYKIPASLRGRTYHYSTLFLVGLHHWSGYATSSSTIISRRRRNIRRDFDTHCFTIRLRDDIENVPCAITMLLKEIYWRRFCTRPTHKHVLLLDIATIAWLPNGGYSGYAEKAYY